jgi:pimeloyl-ACP methyl ester carboxylesterase
MKVGRWLLRILLLLFIVIFILPFLLPLPEVGADPRTLADEDGRFVEIDGLDVYYVEAGPLDGQAVMLLHGFGGSTFSWRENIVPLAEAGFRVIAYDRPNFGLTEKRVETDVAAPAQAQFAARLMDALDVQSAVMVGHSAGGGVISFFALEYPQRVDGLIYVAGAVGSAGGSPTALSSAIMFSPFTRWFRLGARALLTPERFSSMLASAYAPGFNMTPEIAAGYNRVLEARNWDEGFVGIMRDSSRNAFPVERLTEITMPALLIWGRADTWVPLEAGERLEAALTNDALLVYDDVGHLPMEEAPERFNADVIEWIGALDAEAQS